MAINNLVSMKSLINMHTEVYTTVFVVAFPPTLGSSSCLHTNPHERPYGITKENRFEQAMNNIFGRTVSTFEKCIKKFPTSTIEISAPLPNLRICQRVRWHNKVMATRA